MTPVPQGGDCPTTCHPGEGEKLVLVDLVRGNRLTLAETDPFNGILAGRSLATGLFLNGPSASRNHCRLKKNSNGWQVEDLDSSNGTWLNGEKIRRAELQPGDILQMGENRFRIEDALDCQNPQATKNLLTRLFHGRFPRLAQQSAA